MRWAGRTEIQVDDWCYNSDAIGCWRLYGWTIRRLLFMLNPLQESDTFSQRSAVGSKDKRSARPRKPLIFTVKTWEYNSKFRAKSISLIGLNNFSLKFFKIALNKLWLFPIFFSQLQNFIFVLFLQLLLYLSYDFFVSCRNQISLYAIVLFIFLYDCQSILIKLLKSSQPSHSFVVFLDQLLFELFFVIESLLFLHFYHNIIPKNHHIVTIFEHRAIFGFGASFLRTPHIIFVLLWVFLVSTSLIRCSTLRSLLKLACVFTWELFLCFFFWLITFLCVW